MVLEAASLFLRLSLLRQVLLTFGLARALLPPEAK